MKIKHNPAHIIACAEVVSNYNKYFNYYQIYNLIVDLLEDTIKRGELELNPENYRVETAGFILVFNQADSEGIREVEFLVDPYIANLNNYMCTSANKDVVSEVEAVVNFNRIR